MKTEVGGRNVKGFAHVPGRSEVRPVVRRTKAAPTFSNEAMLGIAARALARSFRKPKRKYSK